MVGVTWFLSPHFKPLWVPTKRQLAHGLGKGWLKASGKGTSGGGLCSHSECIEKRKKWYAQALHLDACSCSGCSGTNPWARPQTTVATMKSAKATMDWLTMLGHIIISNCYVCNTRPWYGPVPLTFRPAEGLVVRLWAAEGRDKRLALYVLGTGDEADGLSKYLSNPAALHCMCGTVEYAWRPGLAQIIARPPRGVPRTASLPHWWVLQGMLSRVHPSTLRRGPRELGQSIATFYVLEAIRTDPILTELATKGVAAQRVLDEANALRQIFVEGLAADMLGYLEYAVCSELRHTKTNSSAWEQTVHYDCRYKHEPCQLCHWMIKFQDGTWKDYRAAIKAFPGQADEWWSYADHVFRKVNWETGFGGHAWASITTAAGDYARGANTPAQFLDRAFNLKHNGGLCFDKNNDLFTGRGNHIVPMLDIKRDATGLHDLGPLLRCLPVDYVPLAERALTLLTLHGRKYARLIERGGMRGKA